MSQESWRFHLEKMRDYSHHSADYRPVIALVEWAYQQEWAPRLHFNTSHEHILVSLPGSKFGRPLFTIDNRERDDLGQVSGRFKFSLFGEQQLVLDRWCSPEDAKTEFVACIHFLHCLRSNYSRSITLNPLWLTPTVTALAAAIDEEQAFDRMPILGDALEEAGCDNHGVLAHCRSGPLHLPGCWLVDRIRGRN
jgi:hypothetical protein